MKKLLAALLVLAMLLMGVAALAEEEGHELALVTDVGNIDDHSFNQSAWEGVKQFAEEKGAEFLLFPGAEHRLMEPGNPERALQLAIDFFKQ